MGQKRQLKALVEELLARQERTCKKARAIESELEQLNERKRNIAKRQSWERRFLYAGAAFFAAFKGQGLPRSTDLTPYT